VTPQASALRDGARIPAEPGVWILIGGDLVVFSLFFATYAHAHRSAPAAFAASQALLGRAGGLANTLMLLTGSLCVAVAIQRLRERGPQAAAPLMALGALSGVAFLANKAFEWTHLFASGVSAYDDAFFMYFFMLGGIHALHVVLGIGVLAFLAARLRSGASDAGFLAFAEAGGVFWHLVDVLWLVLFALFYLA
jgi:nitric oxide reductase NorE protein